MLQRLKYVGHTSNLNQRKNNHKSHCNNESSKKYNYYVYQFIRQNGGWNNWNIIEIDRRNCIDLNDACKFEREHMEHLNATLNKYIPTRTNKEYADKK